MNNKFQNFNSQLISIKENCELSQIEYEFVILTEALDVIQTFYAQSDSYSDNETLCEIAREAITQLRRMVEPF